MKTGIINRYLLREISSLFLLGLVIFTLVLLMGRMLKLMEMVVANGIPLSEVLYLILLLLPSFLTLTIPMALLLAVLLTFSRLSADNEITILKASGIGLNSLLPPVIFCAVVATILTLLVTVVAIPWGNSGFKQHSVELGRKYAASAIQERIFRDDLPGIVLYLDHYDEASHQMQRVMIQDSRDQANPVTIFAQSGLVEADGGGGVLRILLKNGTIHTGKNNDYRLISFAEYMLTAEAGKTDPVVRTELDFNIQELNAAIAASKGNAALRIKMTTELQSRFAFPFASIVFAILAVPLGVSNRRSGKGAGFTISIFLLLTYYLLLTFLRTVAEKGVISPVLAVWLPNLVFLCSGLWLLYLAGRERALGLVFKVLPGKS